MDQQALRAAIHAMERGKQKLEDQLSGIEARYQNISVHRAAADEKQEQVDERERRGFENTSQMGKRPAKGKEPYKTLSGQVLYCENAGNCSHLTAEDSAAESMFPLLQPQHAAAFPKARNRRPSPHSRGKRRETARAQKSARATGPRTCVSLAPPCTHNACSSV